MAVIQALPAVFKLGVPGNRRPPDATILQPTVAVSAAGNLSDFQVCAADLDLVGRPDQRLDASSLAIFALVETGPGLIALGGAWVLNNVDLPSFFQTSSVEGPTDRVPVDRR
jgi:hypothetical protein